MPKIGAIILAAGLSKRMGQPKLFLTLNGKKLFRYPVDLAVQANLEPIVLIGGKNVEALQTFTADLPAVHVLTNPNYAQGMASSLKLGVAAVSQQTDASFVFLADQPLVPLEVIDHLTQSYLKYRSTGIRILRPEYNGIPGHPILFDADMYPEFSSIEGDEGGRSIIKRYSKQLMILPFHPSLWGADIDTMEDFMKIEKAFPEL